MEKEKDLFLNLAIDGQRALDLDVAEFFQDKKIRIKSDYFHFLGNHCWHVSNNYLNKNFGRCKDVKTYSYICVLNNIDKFFPKEESEKHLKNLLKMLGKTYEQGMKKDFENYVLDNNKFKNSLAITK